MSTREIVFPRGRGDGRILPISLNSLWGCLAAVLLVTGATACGHHGEDRLPEEGASPANVGVDPSDGLDDASHEAAAVYAAGMLEQAGMKPGASDPAGRPRFVQPVPLVRNLVGDGTTLELRMGRGSKRLPEGARTFLLIAPGRSNPVLQPRPPVFVGNGLYAPEHGVDDFAGLDLEGRPVLVTATPPDSVALARLPEPVGRMYADPTEAQHRRMRDIIDRGAAAILLVPDRWLVGEWDAMSGLRRRLAYGPAEEYPGHVLESPVPVALLHADLVDRLFLGRAYHPISHAGRYGTFELDGVALGLDIDVRREPRVTENVVGILPGRDRALRDEYVLVSAQLGARVREKGDGPSLEDDAAACAALLGAAREVARKPTRRSVLFVLFLAEGGGVWGPLHLLAHPPVPRESIVASIHVGKVGHAEEGSLELEALASPARLARAIEGADRRGGIEVRTTAVGARPFRGTPSEIFLGAGIPSMLVTIGDTPLPLAPCREHLESGDLAEATRLLTLLISETARARPLAVERPATSEVAQR